MSLPNTESQLFGAVPSGFASAQTYQSALAFVRSDAALHEPGMPVGCVRQHLVDDDFQPLPVRLGHQRVEIL